jgi:hypothetical protein
MFENYIYISVKNSNNIINFMKKEGVTLSNGARKLLAQELV